MVFKSNDVKFSDDVYTLPAAKLCIDKIRIVSEFRADDLRAVLPMAKLECLTSYFKITSLEKSRARRGGMYRSAIEFVLPHTKEFYELIAACARCFGVHSVTGLEMCHDRVCDTKVDAQRARDFVQMRLLKPWHRREFIVRVCRGKRRSKGADKGYIAGPTLYMDDRQSASSLKCYARYAKSPGGIDAGKPIVRTEWSLKGKENIAKKTGVERIEDLVRTGTPIPKAEDFVRRHLRILEVDWEMLGRLFAPAPRQGKNKNAWPITPRHYRTYDRIFPRGFEAHYYRRAISLRCRLAAYDELALMDDPDPDEIEQTFKKWRSTAQIKILIKTEKKEATVAKDKAVIWAKNETKAEALSDARIRTSTKPKAGARKSVRAKLGAEARAMAKLDDHTKRMLAMTDYRVKKCFTDITNDITSVETCRPVEEGDFEDGGR